MAWPCGGIAGTLGSSHDAKPPFLDESDAIAAACVAACDRALNRQNMGCSTPKHRLGDPLGCSLWKVGCRNPAKFA